ncbi:hypothetical protein, partial [Streptomyces mexicanus]|uniref:hypothetical protein n=1 Tax=Streptomyces mexicanus TaxID=178566 RepID=UPI0031EB19E8
MTRSRRHASHEGRTRARHRGTRRRGGSTATLPVDASRAAAHVVAEGDGPAQPLGEQVAQGYVAPA